MSNSPTTSKRAAAVAAQRRAGNGTVEDVAAFTCTCRRTVLNWKEDGVIGFTQIGANIWFSEDDMAELPLKYHHSGKFSKVAPHEVAQRVKAQWREFLGALAARDELAERVARLERMLQAQPAPNMQEAA